MFRRIAVVAIAVFVFSVAVRGDTIYLKNGGKFEGQVVSENAGSVVFKIRGIGAQTFRRSEILRLEKGDSIFDEYEAKRKAIGPKDADGFYGLGQWCMENGLRQEAKKAWRSGIGADREHSDSRRALGYTKVKDRWLDRRQLKRYREKRRKEIEGALGTLALGDLVKDTASLVAFRPPKGWKAEDAQGGLGTIYRGPDLHGVDLLIGYEVVVLSDAATVQKSVRRALEKDSGEIEMVKEDVPSSIGGLLARESVCRFGPADARTERHDVCFERDGDVVHVWYAGPADDWEVLRPVWTEITGSFRFDEVSDDASTGGRPFVYELPGPDWGKGLGAASEMGSDGIDFSEPGSTAEVIGHQHNPVLIFILAQEQAGAGSLGLDDLRNGFAEGAGQVFDSFRLLTDKEQKRKVAGCEASVVPYRANSQRVPVEGYICIFAKGDRLFVVFALNIFASMGDKYLKEDVGKLLDSMKVE